MNTPSDQRSNAEGLRDEIESLRVILAALVLDNGELRVSAKAMAMARNVTLTSYFRAEDRSLRFRVIDAGPPNPLQSD